jgi:hypothetical protein
MGREGQERMIMYKIKIMFVVLLAVLVVGAVVSASASACTGLCLLQISSTNKFGKATISNKAIAITGGEMTWDGLRITCPTSKIEGGEVEEGSPAKGFATAAVFTGCEELVESTECELSSSEIRTLKVTAEAVSGSEVEVRETGGLLTLMKINSKSGGTCLVKGKYKITGSAKITLSEPTVEKKNHTGTLSSSGININGISATIAGSGLLLFLLSGVELNWCLLTT